MKTSNTRDKTDMERFLEVLEDMTKEREGVYAESTQLGILRGCLRYWSFHNKELNESAREALEDNFLDNVIARKPKFV